MDLPKLVRDDKDKYQHESNRARRCGAQWRVQNEDTTRQIGRKWEPIAFNVRMVDNKTLVPKGIIDNQYIQLDNLNFLICLVVITMRSIEGSYQMPWTVEQKRQHKVSRVHG